MYIYVDHRIKVVDVVAFLCNIIRHHELSFMTDLHCAQLPY